MILLLSPSTLGCLELLDWSVGLMAVITVHSTAEWFKMICRAHNHGCRSKSGTGADYD